jgi:hypothetical protein
MLLTSVQSAAPAYAQGAADKISPDQLRPDIAQAFLRRRTPTDPTGQFVYLDAYVDLRRAMGAFPLEGITAEFIGLEGPSCYPIYRLRVPAGRVPEIEALLRLLRPPPGPKF